MTIDAINSGSRLALKDTTLNIFIILKKLACNLAKVVIFFVIQKFLSSINASLKPFQCLSYQLFYAAIWS